MEHFPLDYASSCTFVANVRTAGKAVVLFGAFCAAGYLFRVFPTLVKILSTAELSSPLNLAQTTALKGIFQRLATQFGAMYKRKAFLHWCGAVGFGVRHFGLLFTHGTRTPNRYKGEGMDEMEFQEADKNVRDLITEYQDKQVGGWLKTHKKHCKRYRGREYKKNVVSDCSFGFGILSGGSGDCNL